MSEKLATLVYLIRFQFEILSTTPQPAHCIGVGEVTILTPWRIHHQNRRIGRGQDQKWLSIHATIFTEILTVDATWQILVYASAIFTG